MLSICNCICVRYMLYVMPPVHTGKRPLWKIQTATHKGDRRVSSPSPSFSTTTTSIQYNCACDVQWKLSQRASIPTHLFMLCTCFGRIKTITLSNADFVSACRTHITAYHPLGSNNDSECWEECLGPTRSRQETWIVRAQCIPQSAS